MLYSAPLDSETVRIANMIFRELIHRPGSAFLAAVAVAAAAALYTAFHTTGGAANREATRLTRDMGFNLRIVPAGAAETALFRLGYSTETFPETYVQRLAGRGDLNYRHLVALFQQWRTVAGHDLLITGIAPDSSLAEGKSLMIFEVPPGVLYLGFHAARSLGVERGATLDLFGTTWRVEQVLAEKGTEEDVRVYGNLADMQRALGAEGRINEILALECLCRNPAVDSLDILRAQLHEVMPEAKVLMQRDIAKSRERTRLMIEDWFAMLMAGVLGGCALWLAVLAGLNVRERRAEIGVLRALGFGSASVALLVLGRAVFLGIGGALLGFAAGTALALRAGPAIFEVTAAAIRPEMDLLWWVLLAAPGFTALCSLPPALSAVVQDPARVLREV